MVQRAQKCYLHSWPYIFLHCFVDHHAQKAYLSKFIDILSICVPYHCAQTCSIGSDGTYLHVQRFYLKLLCSITQYCCNTSLFVACTKILYAYFAKIARFCRIFKIIHILVERQGEDDSNDVKITLQMLYPDGKNNC